MLFKRKSDEPEQSIRRPNLETGRQNVFSYYARRDHPETTGSRGESHSEPAGRSRLQRWQIISVAVVCLMVVGFSMSASTSPQVNLPADTTLGRNKADYEAAARSAANGSIFNNFKLTTDTAGIERKLQEQFPEIEVVEVTVPIIGRKPNVELTTTKPLFVLVNQTGAYYIAADGRASADRSVYARQPSGLVQLYDQSGLVLQPGKQSLTKTSVSFINQLVMHMQAKDVKIDSLTLPTAPFELHMRVQGKPYYVKFNLLGDIRQQAGAYLALRADLDNQKSAAKEYIDVRVEDRAFYK